MSRTALAPAPSARCASAGSSSFTRTGLALAVLLGLALVVRLQGNRLGLDLHDPARTMVTNFVDERGMVNDVRYGVLHGTLNPGTFLVRGPLGFHLFGLVDTALVGALALAHPGGWTGVVADLDENPALLHLAHRCVSAVAGMLSVWLVFRVVRRELDLASAWCAALVLAFAYVHVRDSHFGTVDVLLSLATLLALDRMLVALREPTMANYVQCGLFAGIAASAKYFGGLLVLHLVLLHLFVRAAERREGVAAPRHGRLLAAFAACPVGFLLVAPGVLLSLGDFARDSSTNVHALSMPFALQPILRNLAFHARFTLAVGLGEPVFALALVGLWLLWRRGHAGRFLVLALVALVPLLVATWLRTVRYGLPLAVALAIPAGVALAALVQRIPRRRVLAVPLILLVLAPSLARSLAHNRVMSREDTRVELMALLREHGLPPDDVLAVGRAVDLPVPEGRAPDLFLVYATRVRRLKPLALDAVVANPPALVVWSLATSETEIPGHDELAALVRERYRPVARLDGLEARESAREASIGNPAIQIPYVRPWTQERPGPALVLYERNDHALDTAAAPAAPLR